MVADPNGSVASVISNHDFKYNPRSRNLNWDRIIEDLSDTEYVEKEISHIDLNKPLQTSTHNDDKEQFDSQGYSPGSGEELLPISLPQTNISLSFNSIVFVNLPISSSSYDNLYSCLCHFGFDSCGITPKFKNTLSFVWEFPAKFYIGQLHPVVFIVSGLFKLSLEETIAHLQQRSIVAILMDKIRNLSVKEPIKRPSFLANTSLFEELAGKSIMAKLYHFTNGDEGLFYLGMIFIITSSLQQLTETFDNCADTRRQEKCKSPAPSFTILNDFADESEIAWKLPVNANSGIILQEVLHESKTTPSESKPTDTKPSKIRPATMNTDILQSSNKTNKAATSVLKVASPSNTAGGDGSQDQVENIAVTSMPKVTKSSKLDTNLWDSSNDINNLQKENQIFKESNIEQGIGEGSSETTESIPDAKGPESQESKSIATKVEQEMVNENCDSPDPYLFAPTEEFAKLIDELDSDIDKLSHDHKKLVELIENSKDFVSSNQIADTTLATNDPELTNEVPQESGPNEKDTDLDSVQPKVSENKLFSENTTFNIVNSSQDDNNPRENEDSINFKAEIDSMKQTNIALHSEDDNSYDIAKDKHILEELSNEPVLDKLALEQEPTENSIVESDTDQLDTPGADQYDDLEEIDSDPEFLFLVGYFADIFPRISRIELGLLLKTSDNIEELMESLFIEEETLDLIASEDNHEFTITNVKHYSKEVYLLKDMFPKHDNDVLQRVLDLHHGDVQLATTSLLTDNVSANFEPPKKFVSSDNQWNAIQDTASKLQELLEIANEDITSYLHSNQRNFVNTLVDIIYNYKKKKLEAPKPVDIPVGGRVQRGGNKSMKTVKKRTNDSETKFDKESQEYKEILELYESNTSIQAVGFEFLVKCLEFFDGDVMKVIRIVQYLAENNIMHLVRNKPEKKVIKPEIKLPKLDVKEVFTKYHQNLASYKATLQTIDIELINTFKNTGVLDLHRVKLNHGLQITKEVLKLWWDEEMELRINAGNLSKYGSQARFVNSATIITGRGLHSVGGVSVLKQGVNRLLKNGNYIFEEDIGRFEVTGKRRS